MSAGGLDAFNKKGESEQDFELNIASIIDCFTVLITYLLVAASFISIGVLDVATDGHGDAAQSEKPPAVSFSVILNPDHVALVKVSGKESHTYALAQHDGGWDFDAMTEQLRTLKDKWPDVMQVSISAEGSVEYRDLVKAVEDARKAIPQVMIGSDQVASQ